jgi:hypothetical protein
MQATSLSLRQLAMTLALPWLAATVQAQTSIDQAKALAGNLTPGDTPYYPITITEPGSYVLTSNLDVPGNQVAIVIDAENVSLDLNGFEIRSMGTCDRDAHSGYVHCSSLHASVSEAPGYSGIWVKRRYASVSNGSISGFRAHGVYSSLGSLSLDRLRVHSNGGHAVVAMGTASSVTNSLLRLNRQNGLYGVAVLVDGVTAHMNGQHGIEVSHGLVSRSVAMQNRLNGLHGNGGPNPTSVRHSQFQFNKGPSEVAGDLVSAGGNISNATLF